MKEMLLITQYAELTRLGVDLAKHGEAKTTALESIQRDIESNFEEIFIILGIDADLRSASDEQIEAAIRNPDLEIGKKFEVLFLLRKGAELQSRFNSIRDELDRILHRLKSIQVMINVIRAQLYPNGEED